MKGPRIKAAGLAALGAVMLVGFTGCDSSENADVANGRALFETANQPRMKHFSPTG